MWGVGVVQAHCVLCGPIRLPARLVTLNVCDNAMHLSRYQYACPGCKVEVDKEACGHVVEALIGVGARIIRWKLPDEALEPHAGPPLTADDLIDLHEQLAAL